MLIETMLALVLALVLVVQHPRYNRTLFARSTLIYLYGLPPPSRCPFTTGYRYRWRFTPSG